MLSRVLLIDVISEKVVQRYKKNLRFTNFMHQKAIFLFGEVVLRQFS